MEQPATSHGKLEKAITRKKQLQKSGTKESNLWVTHDIDWYSVVLDSINFHSKLIIPLMVGREIGYN